MKGASKTFVFLFFLFYLSPLVLSTQESGQQNKPRREKSETEDHAQTEPSPDLVERAIGITDFMNRWDSLKTWAKLAWINLKPPDSGFGMSGSSRGDAIKEAASSSFGTSKETMERTAEAAVAVAEEAVHMATEKVKTLKRSVTSTFPGRLDPDSDAEL